MREITTHKVNGCNEATKIEVLDEAGSGGANHLYKITGFDSSTNKSDPWTKLHGQPAVHSHILFQNGPIPECGTNGLTHEILLAIVADRLECFQRGPFACEENQEALGFVKAAMATLKGRTEKRLARAQRLKRITKPSTDGVPFMALWTKPFPDELDRSALGLVLDAYHGRGVNRDDAAMAAFNLAGYIYGQALSPPLAGDAVLPSDSDVDAAFAAAMDPKAGSDQAGAIPWSLILWAAWEIIKRRRG